MCVMIFSGTVLLDEVMFSNDELAIKYASEMQDQGFKVRVVEAA